MPEQNKVSECSHGAKAAPLSNNSHEKADSKRNCQWGILSTWSFQALEKNTTLRLAGYLWKYDSQGQTADNDEWHQKAKSVSLLGCAPQIVTRPKEQGAGENSCDQSS